jgi:hypothetical protein
MVCCCLHLLLLPMLAAAEVEGRLTRTAGAETEPRSLTAGAAADAGHAAEAETGESHSRLWCMCMQ